jgi:hypothetical protein
MDGPTLGMLFWSLGPPILLGGILFGGLLFAYHLYRRSGPPATKADEEIPMVTIMATHDEPVVNHPYVPYLIT